MMLCCDVVMRANSPRGDRPVASPHGLDPRATRRANSSDTRATRAKSTRAKSMTKSGTRRQTCCRPRAARRGDGAAHPIGRVQHGPRDRSSVAQCSSTSSAPRRATIIVDRRRARQAAAPDALAIGVSIAGGSGLLASHDEERLAHPRSRIP